MNKYYCILRTAQAELRAWNNLELTEQLISLVPILEITRGSKKRNIESKNKDEWGF